MTERDDHELRERFQALRREDTAAAAPFGATLAAARARRAARPRRRAPGLVAATAAALGLALVLRFTRHRHDGIAVDLATVRWEAPTDFLLRLPGGELLRAVPELGTPHTDWRIP